MLVQHYEYRYTEYIRAENLQGYIGTCLMMKQVKLMVEVVAALIWDQNKFMICQRPANKARGLLWEFVGGKVEPDETKEQALIRECQEELAIKLDVGNVFMDVVNASIREGTPQKLEHNDIRWIKVDEIDGYDFCPADEVILRKLKTIK